MLRASPQTPAGNGTVPTSPNMGFPGDRYAPFVYGRGTIGGIDSFVESVGSIIFNKPS